MSTLILLGGGIESVPIIRRVREMGIRAVVVDGDPEAHGLAEADIPVIASCYHADRAIMALRRAPEKFDGVMCAAVDAPVVAAAVAAEFGLPGMGTIEAEVSSDKFSQKYVLRSGGMPVPPFRRLGEGWHGTPGNKNPVVVKPVGSRGGRGVLRMGTDNDIECAEAAAKYGPIMFEEWLYGPQLSTESLVQKGKVLFTAVGLRNYDRLDEFAPHVIEDGFDEPHGQDEPVWAMVASGFLVHEIDHLIADACRALGWFQTGSGVVKGDLVIHDGKLYVIELAARLSGGCFASHGHPLAYGVDFVGLAAKMALGYMIDRPNSYQRQFVCQRYVFPKPEWIGRTIRALGVAGNCEYAAWHKHPGYVIDPVTDHSKRLGQAICTGTTTAEARRGAEQAVAKMLKGIIVE